MDYFIQGVRQFTVGKYDVFGLAAKHTRTSYQRIGFLSVSKAGTNTFY